MIKTTKNSKQNIRWKKINFITGLNGVGKSYFINSISKFITSGINKVGKESIREKAEYLLKVSSEPIRIRGSYSYHRIRNFQEFEAAYQDIQKYGGEPSGNFGQLDAANLIITNMNSVIDLQIKNNFSSLENRVIKFYNSMMNKVSKRFIDGDGAHKDPHYNDFEYVKIKKIIDSFLNGKELAGLNDNGNRILIKDIDGKEITLESLSTGEKYIFALFSDLLENSQTPKIYI